MDPAAPTAAQARSGNTTLLVCVSIGLAVFIATDVVASRSDTFWQWVERGASGSEDAGVVLEARAFALARESRLEALVMGSSVADADFSHSLLAERLSVPRARMAKLWMPAMSDVELAMLSPQVRALRPARVFVPVTPFVMLDGLRWDRTRAYDPSIALRLFSPAELLADRAEHASRAFASANVVVRRRAELRRVLLGSLRDVTAMPPVVERPRIGEQIHTLEGATLADFRCDTVHARALVVFAAEVRAAGAQLVLASAPIAERSVAGSPALAQRLDACLKSLPLSGAVLRLAQDRPPFGRRDFRDLIHLGRAAAERFTEWAVGGGAQRPGATSGDADGRDEDAAGDRRRRGHRWRRAL